MNKKGLALWIWTKFLIIFVMIRWRRNIIFSILDNYKNIWDKNIGLLFQESNKFSSFFIWSFFVMFSKLKNLSNMIWWENGLYTIIRLYLIYYLMNTKNTWILLSTNTLNFEIYCSLNIISYLLLYKNYH